MKNLDDTIWDLIKRICFQTRRMKLEKKVEGSEKIKSLPQMVSTLHPRAQNIILVNCPITFPCKPILPLTLTSSNKTKQARWHTRNNMKQKSFRTESKVLRADVVIMQLNERLLKMLQCANGTLHLLNKPFLYIHCWIFNGLILYLFKIA